MFEIFRSTLEIFTDGSSTGKVGEGGWAFVIINDDDCIYEASGGEDSTTNNRMELQAVIESLRYVYKHYPKNLDFTIYSDSQYVVKGINEWFPIWEDKISEGKEIKNQDLWTDCWSLVCEFPKLDLKWIRGHTGIKYNDRCDKLAKLAKLEVKNSRK